MRIFFRTLTACVIVAASVAIGAGGAPAADAPPTVVEDFEYPQAKKIFKERGINLKRGDGHITLVACGSRPGLIEVSARGMQDTDKTGHGQFCFRVTGRAGYLSLELPNVYGALGNDYDVNLKMMTSDEEKSFKLQKNTWTAVGKTADPQNREFALLEIVAKK
ncbi:hypothetical protein [Streptomyces luteireticuli]